MQKSLILKRLIEETGLSVRQFSIKAGIPYTTLRSILDRGVGNASVDNVLKICRTLGITAEELDDMASGEDRKYEIETIAAHHDGDEWTEEEKDELERFKQYLKMKRKMKSE